MKIYRYDFWANPSGYLVQALSEHGEYMLHFDHLYALAAVEAERDAARARVAEFEAMWNDPVALHVNLCRTQTLTRTNALHLAGASDYDATVAERDALKARMERLEAALSLATAQLRALGAHATADTTYAAVLEAP